MAEPVAASDTVVDDADAAYLYSETAEGDFRKVTAAKFLNALGLTGADEGKIIYVNDSGVYVLLAPESDDDILTLVEGVPAWVAMAANLTALAGLTGAANKLPRFTGAGEMDLLDASAIGAMQYLSTTTASGGSTLEITDGFSTDYDEYVIQLRGILAGTDNQTLIAALSEDGGSNWLSSGYAYSSTLMNPSAVTPAGSDSALAMSMVSNVGSAAGEAVSGELKLFNVSASKTTLTGQFHCFDSSGANNKTTMFGGTHDGSSARVNGVRLTCGSAIHGTARLYGIRNS